MSNDFYATSEKYYEKANELITEFRNNRRCPMCKVAADIDLLVETDFECPYCYEENAKLKQIYNNLDKLLKDFLVETNGFGVVQVDSNIFFDLLLTSKEIPLPAINEILSKYNYEKTIETNFYQIVEKLKNLDVHLTDSELRIIEDGIKLNYDYDIETVAVFFIRNAILGQQLPDYQTFRELLIHFTKKYMKQYSLEPIVKVMDIKHEEHMKYNDKHHVINLLSDSYDMHGQYTEMHKTIELDEHDIEELYYNRNSEVIDTIFHELVHVRQYYDLNNGIISNNNIYCVMDLLLSNNDEYQNNNYEKLQHEVEAIYYGMMMHIDFLIQKARLRFVNTDWIKDELTEIKNNSNDLTRIVDGKIISLQEAFENLIMSKPEILEKYPGLKNYFVISNGMVVSNLPPRAINPESNISQQYENISRYNEFKEIQDRELDQQMRLVRKKFDNNKGYVNSLIVFIVVEIISLLLIAFQIFAVL